METIQHTRLDLESFPESVRKHVDPDAPPPLRMMAAKAMAPMQPLELIPALYQLTLDPEPKIRQAAKGSLGELPDEILSAAVTADLDARVLDVLARQIARQDDHLEGLVLNGAVADETIAFLARTVSERTTEIIAGNHIRLLRTPAIIESLYLNPKTRMSTASKLIDLARRNDVVLSGLPGLQQALDAPEYDTTESGISDRIFQFVLSSSEEEPEDDERVDALLEGAEAETEEEQRRLSVWQQFDKMNPAEKIRIAMIGGSAYRKLAMRDTRKVVHMAAIQSPKVNMGEVTKLASNRSLPGGVVEYIARKREWTRFYPVMAALAGNPKTPLAEAIGFMKQLRVNDLRALQRNKNIPAQLARQAQAYYRQKSSGKGGGRR